MTDSSGNGAKPPRKKKDGTPAKKTGPPPMDRPALEPAAHAYPKLDAQRVQDAIRWAGTGVTNEDLAGLLGVHRASLYRWMADGRGESDRIARGAEPDPAFVNVRDLYDGVRKAQATIVAVAAGTWLAAVQAGDWRAAESLLKTRFMHWRPSAGDPDGAAEGAGTVDDAADLADAKLTDGQARALVGAMRRFGVSLLECAEADGFEQARQQMGELARRALSE